MAESIHEQIAAALRTSLAGIVSDAGATYWYTPGAVIRVSFFPADFALSESYDVVYVLSPAAEDFTEEATGQVRAQASFALQLARKHRVGTENPYIESTPSRWTVVNRLVRDAVRRLLTDVTLGGLAVNVATDSISIDREQYLEGWAMAQLSFTVEYFFAKEAP